MTSRAEGITITYCPWLPRIMKESGGMWGRVRRAPGLGWLVQKPAP
jgi:hypothetical protein